MKPVIISILLNSFFFFSFCDYYSEIPYNKEITKDFRVFQKFSGDIVFYINDEIFYLPKNLKGEYIIDESNKKKMNFLISEASSEIFQIDSFLLTACVIQNSSVYPIGISKETLSKVVGSSTEPLLKQNGCGLTKIENNTFVVSYIENNYNAGIINEFNSFNQTIIQKYKYVPPTKFVDHSIFQCLYSKKMRKILCLIMNYLDNKLTFILFNSDYSIYQASKFPFNFSLSNDINFKLSFCSLKTLSPFYYITLCFDTSQKFEVIFTEILTETKTEITFYSDQIQRGGKYLSLNFVKKNSIEFFILLRKEFKGYDIYLFSAKEKKEMLKFSNDDFESGYLQVLNSQIENNNIILANLNKRNNLDLFDLDIIECRNHLYHFINRSENKINFRDLYLNENDFNEISMSFISTEQELAQITLNGYLEADGSSLTKVVPNKFYQAIFFQFSGSTPITLQFILKKTYKSVSFPSSVCLLKFSSSCYESCDECSVHGDIETHYCTKCKKGYYQLELSSNCYNNETKPENIYFDSNESLYKKCFTSCRSCIRGGNERKNNCIGCKDFYTSMEKYTKNPEHQTNCVPFCNQNYHGWYLEDLSGSFICTETDVKCPKEKPYLFLKTGECRKECQDEDECKFYYNSIELKDYLTFLMNSPAQLLNKNITINETSFSARYFSITYLNNLKKINDTVIILEECENILRKEYLIPETEELFSVIIEISANYVTNQVEYLIIRKSGQILDLSLCSNSTITLYNKINGKDFFNKTYIESFTKNGIDIFNINDKFFKDYCVPFDLNGKDMIVSDRLEQIYQNLVLCEENCIYKGIDLDNYVVKCICKPKANVSEFIIKRSLRLKRLVNYDSNIKLIKCVNNFVKGNFSKNIGFITIIILLIIQLVIFTRIGIFVIRHKTHIHSYSIENNKIPNTGVIQEDNQSDNILHEEEKKTLSENEKISEHPQNIFIYQNNPQNFQANQIVLNEEPYNSVVDLNFQFSSCAQEVFIHINKLKWLSYIDILKSRHLYYKSFYGDEVDLFKLICQSVFFFHFTNILGFTAFFITDEVIHYTFFRDGIFYFEAHIGNIINTTFLTLGVDLICRIIIVNHIQKGQTKSIGKSELLSYVSLLIGLTLFFLYFVSTFLFVYKQTWKIWIISSAVSFSFSMLLPFCTSFIILLVRKKMIVSKSIYLYTLNECLML